MMFTRVRRPFSPTGGQKAKALIAFACGAWLALARRSALADGAFPDSLGILLSTGEPERILLATNFGLVSSEDSGGHWVYVCESTASRNATLYTLVAATDASAIDRVYAVSDAGLVWTDDEGCTWAEGGGALAGTHTKDFFVDPTNTDHVYAVAQASTTSDTPTPYALYDSQDRGVTFGVALFTADPMGGIDSVEATTVPGEVYAVVHTASNQPLLERSFDGGQTWTSQDLSAALGTTREVSIATVDPDDADRVYLRVQGTGADGLPVDSLAVTDDGGQTLAVPVTVADGLLTAFLRRADGTVLLAGYGETGDGLAQSFASTDDGQSFQPWAAGGLRIRGLAEMNGRLYAAADDIKDGMALGYSDDGGATWTALLHFADIGGIKPCATAGCAADCSYYSSLGLFPVTTCGFDGGLGVPPDGGAGMANGGGGGCACAAARSPPSPWAVLLVVLALSLTVGRRGRAIRRR